MTKPPSPPAWAARIWFDDGKFHLDLPAGADLPSHRLAFPSDMQGMIRLRELLRQRNVHSMIGEEGDLTQWQVNKKLKQKALLEADGTLIIKKAKPKEKFVPELRAAARSILRGMGMTGAVRR